ncbi:SDR family NAD(P)-dependent oxidoreductase [Spirochaeta thermophila]|uniref:3-oxoacyl-[acyl-carrier-protein] reductase n=1 Tax=Winmispira thermophila (strain ATCC 49972 / DSM 6192 / RI 19.B1) TaxID=665571 RepID=E0RPT0_WINT6|nr:SDR family NAD(P)-dependent oxidoreductase [Spirochaeta thermophila]ADN01394.1 3-oxoacyl-[acyl-carrier-protein] reductase [Spirochaeta thermophila DSM 6192]
MKLKDRVALVTGSARGIGRAVALRLAQEGASVGIMDLKGTEETAQEFSSMGHKAVPLHADVTRYEEVASAVEKLVEAFGKVDILVNNAGIIVRGHVLDLSLEEWRKVIDVNLHGTFHCCKAVLPYMVKQNYGRIVNITSIAGKVGDITAAPAYGTSKGAVNTLTKSLARQLADYGITVNAVAPHAIETDMSAQWTPEQRKAVIDAIPLKRLGKPEEVAEAVVFLVSEGASFITGEILDVNGGYLMD